MTILTNENPLDNGKLVQVRYYEALKKVYEAAVIKMEDGTLNIDDLSEVIGFIASKIRSRRTSEFDNGPVADFLKDFAEFEKSSSIEI